MLKSKFSTSYWPAGALVAAALVVGTAGAAQTAQASTISAIDYGSITASKGDSLTLTSGGTAYVWGWANGGAPKASGLTDGTTVNVLNGSGDPVAGLAVSAQDSNTYTPNASAGVLVGAGVKGYGYLRAFYNTNASSSDTTLGLSLSDPNALIVAIAMGGNSGAVGLKVNGNAVPTSVDATSNGYASGRLWMNSPGAGNYSFDLINGSVATKGANALGVFVFSNSTNAASLTSGSAYPTLPASLASPATSSVPEPATAPLVLVGLGVVLLVGRRRCSPKFA